MAGKSSETFGFISGQAITPGTGDIPGGTLRGFYVAVAGNVEAVMPDGSTVIWPALAAGVPHPIQAVKILAGSTTATGIVGGR